MWVWLTIGGDVGVVNGRGDVGVVNSKCMVIPFPSHMSVFLLVDSRWRNHQTSDIMDSSTNLLQVHGWIDCYYRAMMNNLC